MRTDVRPSLADFALNRLPDALFVLDEHGVVVESNEAAQGRADIAQLLEGRSKNAQVEHFMNELRTLGAAKADVDLAPSLVRMEGSVMESWFIVIVRDDATRRKLEEQVSMLQSGASFAIVAAVLVHDLNNILTPVLLLSSRLANELPAESGEAVMASEIHAAAALGASLVRDVLSLSRPTKSDIERVDLNAVICERLGLIERLAGEDVEITHELDEAHCHVLADRRRLEHALLNLVANAREAMPLGGRLRIATRVVTDHDHPRVTVSVSDTGIGMTDYVRRHAFDQYFTTRPYSGGTGLGLASVRQFAAASGGAVSLESEPMKGTTVTISLPRLGTTDESGVQPRDDDLRVAG